MATGREHWNAVYDRGGETEVEDTGLEGFNPADQPSVLPVLHALHARQKQGAKCGGRARQISQAPARIIGKDSIIPMVKPNG